MNTYYIPLCIIFSSMHILPEIQDLELNRVYTVEIESTKNIRASVIIPCHPAHSKHLYPLLKTLEEQSALPDEVIISLSEYKQVPDNIMTQLEESQWRFPVTIIFSERTLHPGQNRNLASSKALGDIFIYQDADDQPYPQRIEIIKQLFETYKLDLLMHRFIELHQATDIPLSHHHTVDFLCPSDYDSQIMGKDIHNGNTAISKKLFSTFKWPDYRTHEDETYNRILYKHFTNKIIVLTPLLVYRHYLSSGYEHNLEAINVHIESEVHKNLNNEHRITFLYNTL